MTTAFLTSGCSPYCRHLPTPDVAIHVVQGEPAGALVARGEAELAFQQVSELLPVAGIDFVGPLPDDVQEINRVLGGHPQTRCAAGRRARHGGIFHRRR